MRMYADIIRFGGKIRCTPHWNGDYCLRRLGTLTSNSLVRRQPLINRNLDSFSHLIILQVRQHKRPIFIRLLHNSRKMGENLPDEAPFPLTDLDRWVLSQTDEEFHKHDWDELVSIIGKFRNF